MSVVSVTVLLCCVLAVTLAEGFNFDKDENSCLSSFDYNFKVLAKLVEFAHVHEDLQIQITELKADKKPSCPDGWVTFDGSCYNFMTEKVNFEKAKNLCKGDGSNLVEIETSKENSFLREYLRKLDAWTFWLGMSDQETEGDWRWLDGTKPDYLNWERNQPNNGRISNCGCFYEPFDFQWADEPCSKLYQPICEMEMNKAD